MNERAQKAEEQGLCLYCLKPLDDTRTVRGCHERCDRAARRAIERGNTTERRLVRQGIWGPRGKSGRKERQPAGGFDD
jgi:hypothetical protein